jgi:hypothetical protein
MVSALLHHIVDQRGSTTPIHTYRPDAPSRTARKGLDRAPRHGVPSWPNHWSGQVSAVEGLENFVANHLEPRDGDAADAVVVFDDKNDLSRWSSRLTRLCRHGQFVDLPCRTWQIEVDGGAVPDL